VGQKTSPIGFRLGVVKPWRSRWFNHKTMPEWIQEDEMIRKYLRNRLGHAAISRVEIERTPKQITVIIFTARPGVVIGRKGSEVDKLRDELARLTEADVSIKVEEVKRPELDAQLVADNIAFQLSQRISHRRAMKKAVTSAMRMGAEGIKIQCGGRLGGNEIARSEGYHEGRVPLHTIRADIDFARSTSKTTFGTIGVKVWIFKGEVIAQGGRRLAPVGR
jgi:small subunit ribosomal protein S3